jgi:hypothetical protein
MVCGGGKKRPSLRRSFDANELVVWWYPFF